MFHVVRRLLSVLVVAASAMVPTRAFAQLPAAPRDFGDRTPASSEELPDEIVDVGITEHLGERIPLDVTLRDSAGRQVRVGDIVNGKRPAIVFFVYHTCPLLCSMVLRGATSSLRDTVWSIGQDYDVLTVSFDPHDTPALAAEKKETSLNAYGRDRVMTAQGWHFLVGDEAEVRRLADAIGFRYHWDAKNKQYAHAAGIFAVTPTGVISRYLYGIEFPARDVRLALAESAEGRTISSVDRFLLFCYHYDPSARGYVLYAVNVMRAGAGVTLMLLVGGLWLLWRKEAQRRGGGGAQLVTPASPPLSHPPEPR